MVASRRRIRAEHAKSKTEPRDRSAKVIELPGRREPRRPTYERRMAAEPKLELEHWIIGLVIAGSFIGAVLALVWS